MKTKKTTQSKQRRKPRGASAKNGAFDFRIPPMVRRANKAFLRDLPQLLADPRLDRQWVLYHGEERIGIWKNQFDAYDEARRRGLAEDEFLVMCIIAEPEEFDPSELRDI